jgi:hypothetical protein
VHSFSINMFLLTVNLLISELVISFQGESQEFHGEIYQTHCHLFKEVHEFGEILLGKVSEIYLSQFMNEAVNVSYQS